MGELFYWFERNLDNILITIVGIILGGVLTWVLKGRKRLSYEILHQSTFLTLNKPRDGVIKIFYNDEEVKNVQTLLIRIINTGSIAIAKEDYETPIDIKFLKVDKILLYELYKSSPEYLPVKLIKVSESIIRVEPIMLNKNDFFDIKVILNGEHYQSFEFFSRIKDIPKIELSKSRYYLSFMPFAIGLFVLGVVASLINKFFPGNSDHPWYSAMIISLMGLIIGAYSFLRYKFFPTQKR
ncbi:MAG: hypothetical protein IT279_06545 [Ignavibacteriaceae bacterium]|nr:hypothetical protein [Ignavibacteriaceae bacterium]